MKKRTKRIEIAVTEDEYQMLIERKTSARLAEWMREVALGQQPKRRYPKADPDLLLALARIGSNLNQVARHCNENNALSAQALLALIEIRTGMDALLEAHGDVSKDIQE